MHSSVVVARWLEPSKLAYSWLVHMQDTSTPSRNYEDSRVHRPNSLGAPDTDTTDYRQF